MAAVTQRLQTKDFFDNESVARFPKSSESIVECELTPGQEARQKKIKHIWDIPTRRELRIRRRQDPVGFQSPLMKDEVLPALLAARMVLVHEACANVGYGDAGVDDGIDPEDYGLQDFDIDEDQPQKRVQNRMKSKIARKRFQDTIKTCWATSPRMRSFRDIVDQLMKDGHTKGLIFSEFLSALDVAAAALEHAGIDVIRYDGWTLSEQRVQNVDDFRKSERPVFLLITSKSGGAGLNLQEASVVFVLTPSWNPTVVSQCVARAARAGQTKSVQVSYMHNDDSVERHVVRLMEKKKLKSSQVLDPPEDIKTAIETVSRFPLKKFKAQVRHW